jgi:signal transduction histidine kinase
MQEPLKANEALYTLQKLTRGALAEMRALLLELRPADLHRVRLDIAISQLANAATLKDSVDLDTRLDVAPPLPQKVQVALYRIAQEALNNIVKHARARRIKITLQTDPQTALTTNSAPKKKIVLEIADDGVGFLPEQIGAGHLGLSIMHERAKEVRANLQVVSIPGKGSKVIVIWEDTMLLKEKHRIKGVERHDDYAYATS